MCCCRPMAGVPAYQLHTLLTARMYVQLGSDVAMISKLGNDGIGDNYMQNFQDVNMNRHNLISDVQVKIKKSRFW